MHYTVSADRLVDMVIDGRVLGIGKIFKLEELFSLGNTRGSESYAS